MNFLRLKKTLKPYKISKYSILWENGTSYKEKFACINDSIQNIKKVLKQSTIENKQKTLISAFA